MCGRGDRTAQRVLRSPIGEEKEERRKKEDERRRRNHRSKK